MGETTNRDETNPVPAILGLDHVFEALAHPRRRYLLYTLRESDEWSLRELARKIAAWENDASPETVVADEVDRTYVSLYHTHVPKLVAEDIVAFDESDGTIHPAGNTEQALTVLSNVDGTRDSKQEKHARQGYDEGLS